MEKEEKRGGFRSRPPRGAPSMTSFDWNDKVQKGSNEIKEVPANQQAHKGKTHGAGQIPGPNGMGLKTNISGETGAGLGAGSKTGGPETPRAKTMRIPPPGQAGGRTTGFGSVL